MLVNYATLWLFTLLLSPCNLYLLFTSHFRLIYSGLSWLDIRSLWGLYKIHETLWFCLMSSLSD